VAVTCAFHSLENLRWALSATHLLIQWLSISTSNGVFVELECKPQLFGIFSMWLHWNVYFYNIFTMSNFCRTLYPAMFQQEQQAMHFQSYQHEFLNSRMHA
jgi:hypothetical protein